MPDLPLPRPSVVSVEPLHLREPPSERDALSGASAAVPVPDLPLPRPPELTVADAPARPLVPWTPVADAGYALLGGDYDRNVPGPLAFDAPATLVAIGADWCGPCAEELPELLALASALRAGHDVATAYALVDSPADPDGATLAAERLLDRAHARAALAGTTDVAEPLPAWLAVRPDPRWTWAALAQRALGLPADADLEIPMTLLFDRCGNAQAVVRGVLDADTSARLRQLAADLVRADVPCSEEDRTRP